MKTETVTQILAGSDQAILDGKSWSCADSGRPVNGVERVNGQLIGELFFICYAVNDQVAVVHKNWPLICNAK